VIRKHRVPRGHSVQDLARTQIGAAFAGDWSTLERLYADDVQYRRGDRIVAERNYWDNAALLTQLG
jgi:hypothetical protein